MREGHFIAKQPVTGASANYSIHYRHRHYYLSYIVSHIQIIDVNRFYPKTQLSWLARLDHSHCNSADPLTDGLEVCCVFYRPGPGGCYVCCVVVEGFGEQGEGGGCTTGE